MSGQRNYRKGLDFIPQLAEKIRSNSYILWLGGQQKKNISQLVEKTVKYKNLKNVILIEEKGNDYYDYLNLADGLILTSREDPFPLVMIEAAFLGKPIIGFNSGGIKEFIVENKTGCIINNFDIDAFAAKMNEVAAGIITFDQEEIKKESLNFSLKKRIKIWEDKIEIIISSI